MKDVSIVVPVYNVSSYIELCIQSLINQETDFSYEIILVNDGTQDDSISKAVDCFALNSFSEYTVINEDNKGLPAARNAGAKSASGRFICFIDSDDVIQNNFIQSILKSLKESKADIGYCGFEYTAMNNRRGKFDDNNDYSFVDNTTLIESIAKQTDRIHCCSIILRKEIFEEIQFNEKLKFGEDSDFMWRLFTNDYHVIRVNGKLYKYLIRPNSIMSSFDENKFGNYLYTINSTIDNLCINNKIGCQLKNVALNRITIAVAHTVAKQTTYLRFSAFVSQYVDTDSIGICEMIKHLGVHFALLLLFLKYNNRLFYLSVRICDIRNF